MAINTTSSNGNTTVTITYTALTQKVTDTLTDCAHYLWDHGFGDHGVGVTFESLTNAQKLSLVDDYVKKVVVDSAKTYHSVSAQDTARSTAEVENSTRFI